MEHDMGIRRLTIALGAVGLLLNGLGCGPSFDSLETKHPVLKIRNSEPVGEPLVVDWQPEQRGDLEVAMKDGIAIVSYTKQNGLKLLKNCRAKEGSYQFIGITRKEQVIRLNNADEIAANLPLGGPLMVAKIGGELERGSNLEIAMVMVGKFRTTRTSVVKVALEGECEGATHFVRGALVGAFVLDTGSKDRVRAFADVWNTKVLDASHHHEQSIRNKDGELGDCKGANPDDANPPHQCHALLRLELMPLGKNQVDSAANSGNGQAEIVKEQPHCPSGMVYVGGKCTATKTKTAYECTLGNGPECVEQCKAGSKASCGKLGTMLVHGYKVKKDVQLGGKLLIASCKADYAKACTVLAKMAISGTNTDKNPELGMKLFNKACNAGDEEACGLLGTSFMVGNVVSKDPQKAAHYLLRACKGGYKDACSDLGLMYMMGESITKDYSKAAKLFKLACEGNSALGCSNLGTLVEFGLGVSKNKALATKLYALGCKGESAYCTNFAIANHIGLGITPNNKQALHFYKKACDAGALASCAMLKSFTNAKGVTIDRNQAKMYLEVWKPICKSGLARDCTALGVLAHSLNQHEVGEKFINKACAMDDEWACKIQKLKPNP
jgi:uncharacterized protein